MPNIISISHSTVTDILFIVARSFYDLARLLDVYRPIKTTTRTIIAVKALVRPDGIIFMFYAVHLTGLFRINQKRRVTT